MFTTAPLLVAGYATTRHLYLTLAGVAITLGILLDLMWQSPRRSVRYGAVVIGASLLACPLFRLQADVDRWNAAARISQKIASDVEREATTALPGTLFRLDAPPVFVAPSLPSGRAIGRPWIWSYAIPHVLQSPYISTNLLERVAFVVSFRTYCCTQEQWLNESNAAVRRWAMQTSLMGRNHRGSARLVGFERRAIRQGASTG